MAEPKLARTDTMIDWRRLKPNRALEPDSPEYAWRSDAWNSGPRMAALIQGDLGPLVVTGPPGSGKSTELSAAVTALKKKALPIYVALDRFSDRHEPSESRIATGLLQHLLKKLAEHEFEATAELRSLLTGERSVSASGARETLELVRRVLREARSRLRQRVVLLVDGLDHFETEFARALAVMLRPMAREAGLLVTVAPSALIGPEASDVVGAYRIVNVGAVPVPLDLPGTAPMDAWKFLSAIALQRLGLNGWPDNLDRYAYKAALCSGGIPRQFLQFLQDAVAYSVVAQHPRLMRGDMRVTYRQNHEAAIRLLREGDLPALERVRGTAGVELPMEVRRRLLDTGFLLEYDCEGKTIVQPHPILTEYSVSPYVDGAFL